ncbi:phosphoadenosine phosphosulfate reductase family protein [Butyrivibrio fibrisolvens]|uniref:phosphoadenosine phosphosulfate reductase domain-containing protein n=1 Tax=Butyrivibrio fibrisolvens TaxID=831 RepID=UPI0004149C55|nr:phosphoadenosine phosphosulfate reductase family protein [Butyrivibrio fibrisolvens]
MGKDNCFISLSGGKDSTVLLDIVRKDFPDMEAVFINTGLEYPSVRSFAQSIKNVKTIRPDITFRDVLARYGYPVISKEIAQCIDEARRADRTGKYQYRIDKLSGTLKDKNGNLSAFNCAKYKFLLDAPFRISSQCCTQIKKNPSKQYELLTGKKPIIGTLAEESRLRRTDWLNNGCNAFTKHRPSSKPLSFWTEQDILQYIKQNNLEIASAYGDIVVDDPDSINGQMNLFDLTGDTSGCRLKTTGCSRTGCIFCLFGITQDRDRFIRLKNSEPKLYDFVMAGGEFDNKGLWIPNNQGLGYRYVLEWLNSNGMNINY